MDAVSCHIQLKTAAKKPVKAILENGPIRPEGIGEDSENSHTEIFVEAPGIARRELNDGQLDAAFNDLVGKHPIAQVATEVYPTIMSPILLILVLLLLFGGGGLYLGGPVIGGGGFGLILLVCLVVYFMGGLRTKS